MLHKPGAGHCPRQQLAMPVPLGRLAIGISQGRWPMKLRF
jgi:hypothetical protein